MVYLCLKGLAFMYFNDKQICVNSYWDLFVRTLGNGGVQCFAAYVHYREMKWVARLDTSYGKGSKLRGVFFYKGHKFSEAFQPSLNCKHRDKGCEFEYDSKKPEYIIL